MLNKVLLSFVGLFIICSVSLSAPTSVPDAPVPEVPFTYDVNMCKSPVYDYVISDPNVSCVYTFNIYTLVKIIS